MFVLKTVNWPHNIINNHPDNIASKKREKKNTSCNVWAKVSKTKEEQK